MRLKKLELFGYKSFASRSELTFGEGITAVVGPNGSGKSNVADAIRWVMGEQSYQALRAKSTEDMIFVGSRRRARLGMAEVTITLDNSSGWLPIEYSEVTVGRRAFRSGGNEYLLNGNRVRYRDILDLLGAAGLGRSAYTVIGQGMVDAALALRPEARRALFEEAAGIAPQLRKRAEAERRIQETERNIERVQDILTEIRPRARRLQRQAERAEEHALVQQDLSELQRIWYGHQWQRLRRRAAEADELCRQRQQHLESARAHARSFQKNQESLLQRQIQAGDVLDKLRDAESDLRDQSARLLQHSSLLDERTRMYTRQREQHQQELASLTSREAIVREELEKTEAQFSQQGIALETAVETLASARGRLRSVEADRQLAAHRRKETWERLSSLTSQISKSEGRLAHLSDQGRDLRQETKVLAKRLAELTERGCELLREEREAQARTMNLANGLAETAEQLASTREQRNSLEESLDRAKTEARTHSVERERLQSRLSAIEHLRDQMTGYFPGVRSVLANDSLDGILGTVAALLTVPKEIESAIESALGSRLQNVVTRRWQNAEQAISLLRQQQAGWATFIPLDTIKPRSPLSLAPQAGAIGVASKLVRCDAEIQPVVDLLLGRVVVVRDLPSARRLLGQRTGATLFVTIDGETVQPSGVLSGGSRRHNSQLLAQEREARSLPEQISELGLAAKRAGERVRDCEEKLKRAQERVTSLTKTAAQTQQDHDRSTHRQRSLERDRADLDRDISWTEKRAGQIEAQIDANRKDGDALRQQLGQDQSLHSELQGELERQEVRLAQVDDPELRSQVADLETQTAVIRRSVESLDALAESHRHNLSQLDEQTSAKSAQITEVESALKRLANDKQRVTPDTQDVQDRLACTRGLLEPAKNAVAELEQEEREVERLHSSSLAQLQEAEIEYNQAVLERDRVQDQRTSLARDIETDLGPVQVPETVSRQLRLDLGADIVELPAVSALPQGLGDEIRQLRARLRRMGNVNPGAPIEYAQVFERQTFLEQQTEDLHNAIASIREVISDLDRVIERDFVATVNAVASAFGDYFRRLFDGGSARLELSDPENPSTTGIEIIAHPPGKRAQRLSLLSGGERALTAVALLFALLQANPVPFCFLDEVDAALDESNVARFRDLLESHAESTQFIVITHNRRTIEAASTIYGISMGEQGVSQSVSLMLNQVAERVGETTD